MVTGDLHYLWNTVYLITIGSLGLDMFKPIRHFNVYLSKKKKDLILIVNIILLAGTVTSGPLQGA